MFALYCSLARLLLCCYRKKWRNAYFTGFSLIPHAAETRNTSILISFQYLFRQGITKAVAIFRCSDRYAQELVDTRRGEMTHQNALFPQPSCQRCRIELGMPCKDEVGARRKHFKTHAFKLLRQSFARIGHLLETVVEVLAVFDGRHRRSDRQPIERVRVETV